MKKNSGIFYEYFRLESPEITGLEEKTPPHIPKATKSGNPLIVLPILFLMKAAIAEMDDRARDKGERS